MDTCFLRAVGRTASQYNEDEECLFYQRQTLKLMTPILKGMNYSFLKYISYVRFTGMCMKGVTPLEEKIRLKLEAQKLNCSSRSISPLCQLWDAKMR